MLSNISDIGHKFCCCCCAVVVVGVDKQQRTDVSIFILGNFIALTEFHFSTQKKRKKHLALLISFREIFNGFDLFAQFVSNFALRAIITHS